MTQDVSDKARGRKADAQHAPCIWPITVLQAPAGCRTYWQSETPSTIPSAATLHLHRPRRPSSTPNRD
ncbi:hypothetical protein C8T65DRAFT_659307 [Cerioporus squamosus]|nr:hypothetical protein C8T65DRAFT_659307 [Cerioporus squamosus]